MLSEYTLPEFSVVHEINTSLNTRLEIPPVVYLTQYDQTIPILAISFQYNFNRFKLPDTADANIRMEKPDRTHIYNSALGVSNDRYTLYVAITPQMTAADGTAEAIIEILDGVKVVGTSSFVIDIARNPVPADAYESTDEYKSLQEILAEVQELEKKAADSQKKAAESERWAREYSGNPPIIKRNGDGYYTWWTWNADAKEYQDTTKVAVGNVMYATFYVDMETGHLFMASDSAYTGPDFQLNGTHLEVVLNVD